MQARLSAQRNNKLLGSSLMRQGLACCEDALGESGGQLILVQVEQLRRIGQGLVAAHRHAVVARAVELDVAQPQDGGQQQPHLPLRRHSRRQPL